MFLRLGIYLVIFICVLGITKMYGKARYNEGISSCQTQVSEQYHDNEEHLFQLYEQALLTQKLWRQEALEVENFIDGLEEIRHDEIKKIADASPCQHLGPDVIQLLNSFANPNAIPHIQASQSDEPGKK